MKREGSDYLEKYFHQYPDVPKEVITKEDILGNGLQFSPAGIKACQGCRHQTYYLFTFDRAGQDEMAKEERLRIPEDLSFVGGPYDLRRSMVRVQISTESPYAVDAVDGMPVLLRDGDYLSELVIPPKPTYYSHTFEDGTPYFEKLSYHYDHVAFVNAYRICQFWGTEDECRFCDINVNVKELKKLEGPLGLHHVLNDAEKVAHVMQTALQVDPELRFDQILITGGTVVKTIKGMNDTDFYLQFVEALHDIVGNRISITLVDEAKTPRDMEKLKNAGVGCIYPNVEVWGRELFEKICPGKAKRVGWDEWIRRVVDSVEIMGAGGVSPNFVAGVEMAKPYGYRDVDEAVHHTLEGFDFLMDRGVIPHTDSWCIESGSRLGGHEPIPLDYYIKLDWGWYQLWKRHHLPEIRGFGGMGPGNALYGCSAVADTGN